MKKTEFYTLVYKDRKACAVKVSGYKYSFGGFNFGCYKFMSSWVCIELKTGRAVTDWENTLFNVRLDRETWSIHLDDPDLKVNARKSAIFENLKQFAATPAYDRMAAEFADLIAIAN